MFDKAISKLTEKFSKKTVCGIKKAVVDDIQENSYEYAIAIGIGILLVCGVSKLIGGSKTVEVVDRTVSITYNIYVTTK